MKGNDHSSPWLKSLKKSKYTVIQIGNAGRISCFSKLWSSKWTSKTVFFIKFWKGIVQRMWLTRGHFPMTCSVNKKGNPTIPNHPLPQGRGISHSFEMSSPFFIFFFLPLRSLICFVYAILSKTKQKHVAEWQVLHSNGQKLNYGSTLTKTLASRKSLPYFKSGTKEIFSQMLFRH